MNVAIVDDSIIDRQFLYDNIERYCHQHKVHMQINTFEDGLDFMHTLHSGVYNLVLLDIYMVQSNGLQIAEEIRKRDDKCQIIFITSSEEYAIRAFRLRALDYLLKPYIYEQLEEALNRCETALTRFTHYIELKEGRHYTRILISDILYTDYHNHYI